MCVWKVESADGGARDAELRTLSPTASRLFIQALWVKSEVNLGERELRIVGLTPFQLCKHNTFVYKLTKVFIIFVA